MIVDRLHSINNNLVTRYRDYMRQKDESIQDLIQKTSKIPRQRFQKHSSKPEPSRLSQFFNRGLNILRSLYPRLKTEKPLRFTYALPTYQTFHSRSVSYKKQETFNPGAGRKSDGYSTLHRGMTCGQRGWK